MDTLQKMLIYSNLVYGDDFPVLKLAEKFLFFFFFEY